MTIGTLTEFTPDTLAKSGEVNNNFSEVKNSTNAHMIATSGEHGVSGAIVGTTDLQTVSNKTIVSPTVTGTATFTGTIINDSIIKAWGTISNTAEVVSSFNISSLETTSTAGLYIINFSNAFADTSYCVVAGMNDPNGGNVTTYNISTTSMYVATYVGLSYAADLAFSFIAIGAQ